MQNIGALLHTEIILGKSMSNDLIVEKLDFKNPEIVKKLQETVARNTTPAEFWLFAQRCELTGLNPLNNEIWCIKSEGYANKRGDWIDGRIQIMTGINGFLAVANSYPEFDGLITVPTLDPDGKPISATCTVYRKDRKYPHVCTVYFKEYYKPGYNGKLSAWDKMPITMIEKVAKSRALREAFPQKLNDVYLPEELEALDQQEYSEKPTKHYYDLGVIENEENRALAEEKCIAEGFTKISKNIFSAPGSVAPLARCEVTEAKALGITNYKEDLPGDFAEQQDIPISAPKKDDHISRVRARLLKEQGRVA